MLQAIPEDFELVQPLNGSTPFSYTTSDSLETVLIDNYFQPVRGNLRRGDIIRVLRDVDQHLQVWDLIVLEVQHRHVVVELIGKIYDSNRPIRRHPQQSNLETRLEPEGCSVKRIFGGFAVVNEEGHKICKVSTKAKAEAIAQGQAPVPSQKKAI